MKLRQARKITKRFYEFLQREQNEQNLKEYNTPYGREANQYCQRFSAWLRRSKKLCKLKAENKIQ